MGRKQKCLEKNKAVWRSFWKEWRIIEETLEKEVFKLRIGDELSLEY